MTFEWYERVMVFHFCGIPNFYFSVQNNGKKEHLNESDFGHSYGNFFETVILKVITMINVQLRGTLK